MIKIILLSLFSLLSFSSSATESSLNGANTAWILTATALVLLMTLPGLALFYGGLVRRKNILSILMQCFAIASISSVLWLVVGYSLAFGEGNAWIGDFSKVLMVGVTKDTLAGDIPESLFMFPPKLLDYLEEKNVNFIYWVPSILTTISKLDELGIDMTCGVSIVNNSMTLELAEHQLHEIKQKGIYYNVLIEDMTKFYSERAIRDLPAAAAEIKREKSLKRSSRSLKTKGGALAKSLTINELINNIKNNFHSLLFFLLLSHFFL